LLERICRKKAISKIENWFRRQSKRSSRFFETQWRKRCKPKFLFLEMCDFDGILFLFCRKKKKVLKIKSTITHFLKCWK